MKFLAFFICLHCFFEFTCPNVAFADESVAFRTQVDGAVTHIANVSTISPGIWNKYDFLDQSYALLNGSQISLGR